MIQKNSFEKGQLFSLDFVIAISITVLAIGLLLNFYELNVYEAKEARINTETQIVATTAANILLEANRCEPIGLFQEQGYKLFGCTNNTEFSLLSKAQMMIPDNFSCYITIDGDPIADSDCPDDAPPNAQTVISIQRTFLASTEQIGPTRIPIDLMFVFDKSTSMGRLDSYDASGIESGNDTREVYVEGTVAYIADDDLGVQSLDVSDPNAVDFIAENPPPPTKDAQVIHSRPELNQVFVILDQPQVRLVALDKTSLSLTGGIDIGVTTDMFVERTFAYLLENNDLQIYDVSNVSSMSQVPGGNLPLTDPEKIIVEADSAGNSYAYILNSGNLEIVDVTTPGSLSLTTAVLPTSMNDFDVLNEIVYYVDGTDFWVIDTSSDKLNPAVLGSFALPGGDVVGASTRIHESGETAFVQTYNTTALRNEDFMSLDLRALPAITSNYSYKEVKDNRDWIVAGDIGYFVRTGDFSLYTVNVIEGSPLLQAQNSIINFVNTANFQFDPAFPVDSDRIGFVSFNSLAGTTIDFPLTPEPTGFEEAVRAILPGGGTNIEAGIDLANIQLLDGTNPDSNKIQILLSDGKANDIILGDPVGVAAANDITIYTVAYRLSGAGADYLQTVADLTFGIAYSADDGDALSDVLLQIAGNISGLEGGAGELDKGGFEICIETGVCDVLEEKEIIMKIWKQ